MNTGKVKWFDSTKGYGFIEQEGGGADVFVHISEVKKSGTDNLDNDQAVTYEIQTKLGKSSAINLKLVSEGE